MTPAEREAYDTKVAARQAALAKYRDGTQQILDEDVPWFSGDELRQLADVGRLTHLGIGPDRRLRR